MIKLKGSRHFRSRIICSTLSGRPIRIDDIRVNDENPGMRDYEANLLRLVEKITNGCSIEINETGTALRYKPGVISGGNSLTHDCGQEKGVGYFVEALLCLAPFGKAPLAINLLGQTNTDTCLSVDTLRTVTLPFLRHFGISDGLELKVKKRGAPPLGGGDVFLRCPVVKALRPIDLLDAGLVRRVRGVAYSTRVSPQVCNRLVDAARGVLNPLLPDVFVYTDHYTAKDGGLSAGYGLSLVAETVNGCAYSAEGTGAAASIPEDLGERVASLLCEEMASGGTVDCSNQHIALLFMTLCPEDVSRIRFGKLTPYSIQQLRLLKEFFGITFKIQADPETKTVVLSCLGTGFRNLAKRIS